MPHLSSQSVQSWSVQSWTEIRSHAELFTWQDPTTHLPHRGLTPPPDAISARHVPFQIRSLTTKGHILEGKVISVGFDPHLRLRRLKFVESGEIRPVYDMLIISINNTRFVTH